MESSIMRNASRFLREQKKKRKWQKVLACLALVVAAGTTIALIMPGQALNNTEKVLDCQIEVHQHTADCYGEDGTTLICGLADYVAHTHNELCYNEEGELICKLPEMPAHQHTADCYAEERVLTCGLEETPEDGEGIPVSGGDQENAAPHVHTDECYTTVSHLICGQLEAVEHVHTDACFKEVTVDGEKEATDGTLTDTEFTDVSPGDLVAAARDEWYFCGKKAHTHSEECYDEEGNLVCGLEEHEHTEDCLKEVVYGCGLEAHTHSYSCYDSEDNLICGMQEHEHDEECIIRYWCGHVTHTHNAACYAGADVTGGDNAAALNCGLEEHEHTEECLTVPILERVYEDSSIRVTATYPASAMIPEDAEFRVVQITEDSDPAHYGQRSEEAQEIFEGYRLMPKVLLNIGFFAEDGTELQPEAPVEISLQFLNEDGGETGAPIVMVHFAESGAEVLDNTFIDKDGATTFVTEGFSDFLGGTLEYDYIGAPAGISLDYNFTHNKYIDYLGNGSNADTTLTGEDMYRLYLDMEGKSTGVDVLFVIDRSASMAEGTKDVKYKKVWEKNQGYVSYKNYSVNNETRSDREVYDLLYGTDANGTGSLIKEFLDSNTNNKVALVWFAGKYLTGSVDGSNTEKVNPINGTEGGVIQEWTNTFSRKTFDSSIRSQAKDNSHAKLSSDYDSPFVAWGEKGITNYVAGYFQADMMLKKVTGAKDDGNKKIVIFLSDGLPTVYYKGTVTAKDWDNYENNSKNNWIKRGSGAESSIKSKDSDYITWNEHYFDQFVQRNSGVYFYPIAFKMSGSVNGISRKIVLDYMASKYSAKGSKTYSADNYNDLKKAFEAIMYPSGVVISDTLSAYVDIYSSQADIKVSAIPKTGNGSEIIFYQKATTSGNPTINDTNVIEYVHVDGKTVSVKFKDSYALSAGYKYTLSFNVRLTDKAFDDYAKNGEKYGENGSYNGNKGDVNTDITKSLNPKAASENATSSGKLGFNSNASATVTYKVDGKEGGPLTYEDPVVQPWKSILEVQKIDENGNPVPTAEFKLTRDGSLVTPSAPIISGTTSGYYCPNPDDGKLAYNNLQTGTYTLTEKIPEGYAGAGTEKSVTFTVSRGRITSSDTTAFDGKAQLIDGGKIASGTHAHGMPSYHANKRYILKITNDHDQIPLMVKKVDKAGNELTGAEFTLFKKQSNGRYVVQLSTGTVNEDGYVVWDSCNNSKDSTKRTFLLGGGQYKLEETTPPENYTLPGGETDKEKNTVYFEVKTATNGSLEVVQSGGGNSDLWYTGEDGSFQNPSANKDGSGKIVSWTVTIKNQAPNIKLDLTKLGVNEKPLAGAGFELLWKAKGAVDTAFVKVATAKSEVLSDGNGSIQWTLEPDAHGCSIDDATGKITLPEGTYWLKETTAPAGHQLLTQDIKFTVVLKDGALVLDEGSEVAQKAGKGYTITSTGSGTEVTIEMTVINEPNLIQIQVKKVGNSGTLVDSPLAGAKFYLFSLPGGNYNDESYGASYELEGLEPMGGLLTSGSDGMISLGNLPFGWYCLQEVAAPEGYNKLEEVIIFRVYPDPDTDLRKADFAANTHYVHTLQGKENGSVFEITVKNEMGALLPETGGNGIVLYILSGLALAMTALIALIYKKKLCN